MKMDGAMLTVGDLKQTLRDELGLSQRTSLVESFVAQPKQFTNTSSALNDSTFSDHISLYEGYIRSFNATSAQLDTANREDANPTSQFRSLKRDETYLLNAIYLHELFFANVGDKSSMLHTDSIPYIRLSRDFGEFDSWSDDFIACALSAREGWVVTCLNMFLKRYVNVIVDGHDSGIPLGCMPVLVIDMWTHSRKDFKNAPDAYVRAMMSELNWRTIESRFVRAEHVVDALK